MSSMVEKAVQFYLEYPEVVDEVEPAHGKTHRVYACPECQSSLIEKEGELVALKSQPGILSEEVSVEVKEKAVHSNTDAPEELVPC
ncbi:MAG: hypothetical protein SW833_22580 [Cyanobacteriota bacterium]|nr:hypothetical protein [Cyanobacteriota bacterium]